MGSEVQSSIFNGAGLGKGSGKYAAWIQFCVVAFTPFFHAGELLSTGLFTGVALLLTDTAECVYAHGQLSTIIAEQVHNTTGTEGLPIFSITGWVFSLCHIICHSMAPSLCAWRGYAPALH